MKRSWMFSGWRAKPHPGRMQLRQAEGRFVARCNRLASCGQAIWLPKLGEVGGAQSTGFDYQRVSNFNIWMIGVIWIHIQRWYAFGFGLHRWDASCHVFSASVATVCHCRFQWGWGDWKDVNRCSWKSYPGKTFRSNSLKLVVLFKCATGMGMTGFLLI